MGGAYGPTLAALRGIGALGDDTTDTTGFDWSQLANIITAGATGASKIITATQGCPIGLQMNAAGQCAAPVIGAGYPGAAVGTVQTPLGSAALGVSGTTIAMFALAGLVVVVLFMKK
jgi:hypothetical protein